MERVEQDPILFVENHGGWMGCECLTTILTMVYSINLLSDIGDIGYISIKEK